jgi:hypothetical protein
MPVSEGRGDLQHDDVRVIRLDPAANLDAVDVGQLDVEQHQVRGHLGNEP